MAPTADTSHHTIRSQHNPFASQEILQFQHDRSPEVRKQVIAFVEVACKKDAGLLPRVSGA